MAEKNLLKIFLSNKNIQLQVVNNKTGHIFLQANTLEKALRDTLSKTWDRVAAQATAGLLARRESSSTRRCPARSEEASHTRFTSR